MLNALWILAAANLAYLLFRIISKKSDEVVATSPAEEVSFLDVPDEVLKTTPVMPKAVNLKDEPQGGDNWWDQKINLPRASQSVSRRGRKIEHDQLLLSDLDQNL